MHYYRHEPAAPLSALIEYLWMVTDGPAPRQVRIVPNGAFELVIHLTNDEVRVYDPTNPGSCRRYSGTVVSGVYSRFGVIDSQEHSSIIGVHFRPGGAFPFFGIRSDELADTHVDLETFWGRDAGNLRDHLCSTNSPEQRLQILEQSLMSHLNCSIPRRREVLYALKVLQTGTASIADVVKTLELSHRRFIEVFTSEVGITPKLFDRIQRFQCFVRLAAMSPAPDWGELAVECGYFDQSHLIRDCHSFSGFSPTEYKRRLRLPIKEGHIALD